MAPERPLPHNERFASPEEYTQELLEFVTTSEVFQILCGGVHILDFFTIQPGLFHASLPKEWHPFLLSCPIMRFLDLLVRDDLDDFTYKGEHQPPDSLIDYIRSVRDLSLSRKVSPQANNLPKLPRSLSVGMKPKKIHEVSNFAEYVERLSEDVSERGGGRISHYVDFGSGQNYLGRALASEPYNRQVVAVEGREINVNAAKSFDITSGLVAAPKVRRNKKLWSKVRDAAGPEGLKDPEARARAIKEVEEETGNGTQEVEFNTKRHLAKTHITEAEAGKGYVQYVYGKLDSGDLADVISNIQQLDLSQEEEKEQLNLMAVSIHSCGNLSHFGIRSLLLNPDMKAVAIVGCCYNMLTEKLGPPSYKHPYLRPTLQAVNAKISREADKHDPEGFPMSNRFATYKEDGVRLNITARMMACQALENWTEKETDGFFTRHFYRAVTQKMFLDRGLVTKRRHRELEPGEVEGPFDFSTDPVIVGSLPPSVYASLKSYVRAAVNKVIANQTVPEYAELMREKMGNITDEEIEEYEKEYLPRKPELNVVWSMMAFSAIVVESLIVTDRWTFLKEHSDVVDQAWVEPVFDFTQSPRNLVVVGIKK